MERKMFVHRFERHQVKTTHDALRIGRTRRHWRKPDDDICRRKLMDETAGAENISDDRRAVPS